MGWTRKPRWWATQNFWDKLTVARQMPFGLRVGLSTGNGWDISAPAVQYVGLSYKDRSGLAALDAALQFNGVSGDDEIAFFAY